MTKIIAEVGSNWDPKRPLESWVEYAALCDSLGIEYIKCQVWSPLEEMRRPEKWKEDCGAWTIDADLLSNIAMELCEFNVDLIGSVFTKDAASLGLMYFPLLKIASSELANNELLNHIGGMNCYRVPILASMGVGLSPMRTLYSLAKMGATTDVTLMHCVSVYPTPKTYGIRSVAPLRWGTCRKHFGLPMGWSSHMTYPDVLPCAAKAVKMGARYIEVHVRLHGIPENCPDNGLWALLPDQLEDVVTTIRSVSDAE